MINRIDSKVYAILYNIVFELNVNKVSDCIKIDITNVLNDIGHPIDILKTIKNNSMSSDCKNIKKYLDLELGYLCTYTLNEFNELKDFNYVLYNTKEGIINVK